MYPACQKPMETKIVKKRTNQQNRAIHKYFDLLAEELNESGISVQLFLQDFEVDYTPEMIKNIFRKIAKEKFGKIGTSKLSTIELTYCWEELNRHIAKFGLHIPFPSIETLNYE